MPARIADQDQRECALDPRCSFLVQAPAGSGKTELLIQRFMTLLALVEEPEAVLAITFTKKAAGEMRERVLQALEDASRNPEPAEPHKAATWRIASRVLARDRELGWRLLEHPSRLAVQTIDALCLWLTRRMPLTSGFGAQPGIVEDAAEHYEEAARRTLALLDEGPLYAGALETVLRHIDNHLPDAQALLATMLPKRDQWLRLLAGSRNADMAVVRAELEKTLRRTISASLERVRRTFPEGCERELMRLGGFAARSCDASAPLADLGSFPPCDPAHQYAWRAVAGLLLTQGGKWRRAWSAREGFPPGTPQKADIVRLCDPLRENEQLREALELVRSLPPPCYTDSQWRVLAALLELLPVAAAQLRLVFRERGEVDFAELAAAAIQALGPADTPSELAYSLDCRIEHLLVDEFQDTSFTQWTLLERLVADWQPGDGRTLFCVGDPMQSIFRFRDAEVGLFLQAREEGLGPVRFEYLTLTANFRSDGGIVEWNNDAFRQVLPPAADSATGAVPYTPAVAVREPGALEAVAVHPFTTRDDEAEARLVHDLIANARAADPDGSIAVLFRSRTAAQAIAGHLRDRGVEYQAVDMNLLSRNMVVRDLLSLTRALLHPGDRVSWLAVLRAPWCGLRLCDLTVLAGDRRRTVWQSVSEPAKRAALSVEGEQRLQRISDVLGAALRSRGRLPLRTWVEQTWIRLGGPECLGGVPDRADAEMLFRVLEELDRGGDVPDLGALDARIAKLYSRPDPVAGTGLQLLTMHKAKGLEFDTVIVPGLGRLCRSDSEELLAWVELPAGLLLAPIREAGVEDEPLSKYVTRLESEKTHFEEARLLYVAATRARRRLHLIGHIEPAADGTLRPPPRNSLLHLLWPVKAVRETFEGAAAQGVAAAVATPSHLSATEPNLTVRRVAGDWLPAALPRGLPAPGPAPGEPDEAIGFVWSGDLLRHAGTVIHATLERIAGEGPDAWTRERIAGARPWWTSLLRALGLPVSEFDEAVDRIRRAVVQTLADERGRWILSAHSEARTEFSLSGLVDREIRHVKIDRTFVDEHGVRWVIDYKTATVDGGDVEVFLDSERDTYLEQLGRYSTLIAALDGRPVRAGLYFPLLTGWREWAIEPAVTAVV